MPEACLTILGLGLNLPWQPDPGADALVRACSGPRNDFLLAGGQKQLELFSRHYPLPEQVFCIKSSIADLTASILAALGNNKPALLLAGGDPLYYGIASSLLARPEITALFQAGRVRIIPNISSLQGAAARLGLPWANLRSISLHGRNRASWLELAQAAMRGQAFAVLTDQRNTPDKIAAFLLERGQEHYTLRLFENLGCPEGGCNPPEKLQSFTLEEAARTDFNSQTDSSSRADSSGQTDFNGWADFNSQTDSSSRADSSGQTDSSSRADSSGQTDFNGWADFNSRANAEASTHASPARPACPLRFIILTPTLPGEESGESLYAASGSGNRKAPVLGMDDDAFFQQNHLISKRLSRAAILSALRLQPGDTLFDLGAGCGSLGVEACALLPEGVVHAVEKDAERVALIAANRKKFGAANLEIHHADIGEFLRNPPDRPQRIFFGGGLSHDPAPLLQAWELLPRGGRLVASCILLNSLETCRNTMKKLDAGYEIFCLQQSAGKSLAGQEYLKAHNPVFILAAQK